MRPPAASGVVFNVCPAAWLDAEEAFHWAVVNAAPVGSDTMHIVVGGTSAKLGMTYPASGNAHRK